MVDVAPLPIGFDLGKTIDAAELPATAPDVPTPVGWGARAHEFLQGWHNTTPEAERTWQEAEAYRRHFAPEGTIKHASQIAAERQAREEEAERRRKAFGDPRKVLAAAHQLRSEALAEVARLEKLAARADELVREIGDRHREQTGARPCRSMAAPAPRAPRQRQPPRSCSSRPLPGTASRPASRRRGTC